MRRVTVVWITGTSGSGKSAVCAGLKEVGHRAFDADEGFCQWVHRLTGQVVTDRPDPAPAGWIDQFGWKIVVERVRELAASPADGLTFLCGSIENEIDVWQYFDQVVCLVADDETIGHRLATRTTNGFGKHPEELAAVLRWNQTIADRYRELGAAIVDGTCPLDDVVREVLAVVAVQ